MTKRYFVWMNFQTEEENDPENVQIKYTNSEGLAKDYFMHFKVSSLDKGKCGAVTMYSYTENRETGEMENLTVVAHAFKKFAKMVRYNMEKKTALKQTQMEVHF